MRRRATSIALLVFTSLVIAAGGDSSVPWPRGAPPSGAELRAIVDEAIALADRERFEEELEAYEKGEDSEHVFVLQSDIDANLHDLARLFRFGDSLFGHEFRHDDGYGDSSKTTISRIHAGVRGGRDTFSCAGCHSVGGADGAGSPTQNAFLAGDGDHQSSANVRNAPLALGLGLVQALASEMTTAFNEQRLGALASAAATGNDAAIDLVAKGISFGRLIAHPDGSLDTTGVEGVDPDLIVRPFGWKGTVARLRRFVEDAARVHFGIQSTTLTLGYDEHPDVAHLGPGPNWWDPDNDGKQRELEEGTITATAVYLAMLEIPAIIPPHDNGLRERWGRGSVTFEKVGCSDCHKTELQLAYSSWREMPDTTDGAGVVLNLLQDGEQPRSSSLVKVFSDLKRHDMGDELADAHDNENGLPRAVFLTRPLWGLAESAPYLHDGRAATIPEAIFAHGGEAAASRDAFAALSAEEQADVHIFLLSLTRESKVRVAR